MSTQFVYRDTYIIVVRGEHILVQLRADGVYRGGEWGVPSGKVELYETYHDAAMRELVEETGLLPLGSISLCHLMNRVTSSGDHWIGAYFTSEADGEPQNLEPEKHRRLEWVHRENLPNTLSDYVLYAIQAASAGELYSDWYE